MSDGSARRRVRVLVSGLVQGVWFREGCRQEAVANGVAGWVRNLADGRVEACIEGGPDAIDRVVSWCHGGPAQARVTGVEVHEETPTGEVGFRVR